MFGQTTSTNKKLSYEPLEILQKPANTNHVLTISCDTAGVQRVPSSVPSFLDVEEGRYLSPSLGAGHSRPPSCPLCQNQCRTRASGRAEVEAGGPKEVFLLVLA